LKQRLQQAESERFPVAVLYGLLALVLASLTAVAYLWNRQRRLPVSNEDWWNAAAPPQSPLDLEPDSVPPAPPVPTPPAPFLAPDMVPDMVQMPHEPVLSAPGGLSEDDLDVNLMDMTDSTFGDFLGLEAYDPARYPPPPLPLVVAPTKPVLNFNSDTALDLRQQAEFFVSLGETERAIRLLKRQIEKNEEHNPFVYLDLLEILHSLNLKSDFQQWRERFLHVFSGHVPEFANFKQEGKSLESYPEVLSRLTAHWSSPGILADIDACIFQAPDGGGRPAFDLAAFRDLLLLHAVAYSPLPLPAIENAQDQVDALSTAVVRSPHQAGTFNPVSDHSPALPTRILPAASAAPPLLELDLDLDLDLDLTDVPLDAPVPGPAAASLDFELPGVPDGDQFSVSTHAGLIDFELVKLSKND
jgi:pilus assembly protein FimV